MKIGKIISAIAAAAVAVSAMAVSAFAAQDTSGLADGTAYLNINNDQWGDFDAEWTNAEITGDGTYTVSMTGADNIALAQFNALEIINGEIVFGRTYTVTVDSIKINGDEKKIAEGYTCSADGGAVITRVNLYNEWNAPSTDESADGYVDCRSADGDFMSKTAQMVSYDDLSAVQSIEVTFTVSGTGASDAAPAETEAVDDAAPAETEAVVEETPVADSNTTSTTTGNTPALSLAAAVAASAAVAFAVKKSK
ncbi:MAG: hypothetical protein NC120_02605 [Ruminococcus sp.]|nr:hypothetical protein [Ruminococcus sp.]